MRRRRCHNAFTTIELLVAISILVILAGMVFVGFKVVGTGGKTRSTQTALESARAMLTEVDASGGMSQIKAIYTSLSTPNNYFPPLSVGTPTALAAPTDSAAPAPKGNVSLDAYSTSHNIRFESDAVVLTQKVMGRLLSSPVNRTTLNNLPAERLLKGPGTPLPTGGFIFTNNQPNPAVLVDAWNNPIIYVPPSGLRGVYLAAETDNYKSETAATEHVVTSTGTYLQSTYTAFAPGATGFWASAGPDGDFTTGDDNLYSFE